MTSPGAAFRRLRNVGWRIDYLGMPGSATVDVEAQNGLGHLAWRTYPSRPFRAFRFSDILGVGVLDVLRRAGGMGERQRGYDQSDEAGKIRPHLG